MNDPILTKFGPMVTSHPDLVDIEENAGYVFDVFTTWRDDVLSGRKTSAEFESFARLVNANLSEIERRRGGQDV